MTKRKIVGETAYKQRTQPWSRRKGGWGARGNRRSLWETLTASAAAETNFKGNPAEVSEIW